MKLDDWKARLRAPKIVPDVCDRPLKPVVVFDGPPTVPPLMLLIKPGTLMKTAGRFDPNEFVILTDRDHRLFEAIGHNAPLIEVENDRNILSGSISFRFRLTNEGHAPMIMPAKFRRRNDGAGEFESIELIAKPYREPRFNGLLHEAAEVIKDDILAAWAREDSIQFGAWPEGSKLSHKRTIIGLECVIESPDGARAPFTIRVDGEALSVPLPPFLGASINLDEKMFHGR